MSSSFRLAREPALPFHLFPPAPAAGPPNATSPLYPPACRDSPCLAYSPASRRRCTSTPTLNLDHDPLDARLFRLFLERRRSGKLRGQPRRCCSLALANPIPIVRRNPRPLFRFQPELDLDFILQRPDPICSVRARRTLALPREARPISSARGPSPPSASSPPSRDAGAESSTKRVPRPRS